jgi:phosphoglycerate dehydrogenase-like enzyme
MRERLYATSASSRVDVIRPRWTKLSRRGNCGFLASHALTGGGWEKARRPALLPRSAASPDVALLTTPRDHHYAMDIGFVGLGAMGTGMAANLLKAGHTVRVWNRSRSAADALVHQGTGGVGSPREAFAGDAVFMMLSDDDAVRSVLTQAELFERPPASRTLVNMSTVSVSLARTLDEESRSHGIQ